MGKAHSNALMVAPLIEPLGVTVVKEVLVDIDAESAARSADELGWRSSSSDWQKVISRADIDIVDICTPPQFHREIALAAIAAGKHVFCEKPIANSSEEAYEMAEAAERAGVVAQLGFNYRHTPAIEYAKQLLEAGELGDPLQFRACFLQDGGFISNPNRWRARRSTGGSGAVGDVGSHILDIAEYLFGDIVRVNAQLRTFTNGRWMPDDEVAEQDALDDVGIWMAQFSNGALGTFEVSTVASGRKNHLAFSFDATKAALEFDWNYREEFRLSRVDDPADQQGFKTIRTFDIHPDGWWKLAGLGTGYTEISAIQFKKFLRSIVDGAPVAADFRRGARIQQIVETVVRSAQQESWQTVPVREASPVEVGA